MFAGKIERMRPNFRLSICAIIAATFQIANAQTPKPACHTPPASEARPWLNAQYSPQCRAQFVLEHLKTVDDKFAYLSAGAGGGRGAAAAPANPALDLGLNRGGSSDGLAGVARGTGVTAFPSARTFSTRDSTA
jgi:hypothetical protein